MADLMAAIFPAEGAHAGRMLGTMWKVRHVQNARHDPFSIAVMSLGILLALALAMAY